ncbi:MAG: polysaccharide biosynthesis/export family protein [Synergistaceae bacterium]|nr:polysaccharide biosynthesis/export family protein [Synergistaceae bacterium]
MKKFVICLASAIMCIISIITLPFFVPVARASDYVIGRGDTLFIQVTGHSELSSNASAGAKSQFIVRPDGKMNFQLIGEVTAAGKTVSQFTEELTRRIEEYIVKPRIAVNVTAYGSKQVFLLGEVQKPGTISLSNAKGQRVLDALSAAGGFTRTGEARWVLLIRADTVEKVCEAGKTPEGAKILEQGVTKLNIQRLISKGDLSQNVELNEGDFLFVTRNHRQNIFDILGRVLGAAYQIYKLSNGDV